MMVLVRTCWFSKPELILFQINLCTEMYKVCFGVLPVANEGFFGDPPPNM